MARNQDRFNGYRGRRTASDTLKLIAIILAVLVVILFALLLYGQRFLIFTDSGVRLAWPFQRQEHTELPEVGDVNVTIRPSDTGMAALELPVSAVLDGSAVRQLAAAGADTLVLEMKDPYGQLSWTSSQNYAVRSGANPATAGTNEMLRVWNQGNIYTVALVNCFRDDIVAENYSGIALKASYGPWRDELGMRWLDPDSAEARAYLAGLCAELAELGFDEIVLAGCGYPTAGWLTDPVESGSEEAAAYAGVAEGFLDQVREAVAPYGTALSVRTDRDALSAACTGLTPAGLDSRAEKLWITGDDLKPDLSQLLESGGFRVTEDRLVTVVSDLKGVRGPRALLKGE